MSDLDIIEEALGKWPYNGYPSPERDKALEAIKRISWQPISTAPKDGIEVLLTNGEGVYIRHWCTITEEWSDWGMSHDGEHDTHWKPLPEPPQGGD